MLRVNEQLEILLQENKLIAPYSLFIAEKIQEEIPQLNGKTKIELRDDIYSGIICIEEIAPEQYNDLKITWKPKSDPLGFLQRTFAPLYGYYKRKKLKWYDHSKIGYVMTNKMYAPHINRRILNFRRYEFHVPYSFGREYMVCLSVAYDPLNDHLIVSKLNVVQGGINERF